jgi:lysophospholipase L1-like esterase
MKTILLHLIHVCISPLYFIALPQGLWIKKHALRMPEAEGPRTMSFGDEQKPAIKLLYLGESPAAGVGITEIKNAVSAQVAYKLAKTQKVEWQLLAQNGIKIKQLLIRLKETETQQPDISIITLGVNDCTGLTPSREWQQQVNELILELRQRGSKHIFFTAVPPLHKFPLLPAPLNWVMGHRANILNNILHKVCRENNAKVIAFSATLAAEYIAIDGYHPNEIGAELWANSISQQVEDQIK